MVITLSEPGRPHADAEPLDRNTRTRALFVEIAATPERRHDCREQIVLLHLDVAESVARRYRSRGVPHDDLLQVACLGLVKAVQRFDLDRSENFLSYAVPTMLGEVKRFFRDHAWVVRPPRRVQELQSEIAQLTAAAQQQFGRAPTVCEIEASTGADPDAVREALQADNCYAPASLDRPTTDDGSALGELVGVDDAGFGRAEAVSTLRPICAQLTERDRRIIYLRFFREWTQARIAEELDVTQMQVSRLLRRILAELRDQLIVDDRPAPLA